MLERVLLPVGTLSAQISKILGMRVVSGEFRPGDILPIESELCRLYGVSRTVVREAVKDLSAKRLVDVSPKVGTRVLPFAEWNLLDRDVLSWRLSAQFDAKIIEDIFEMRLCFEPRASFLAARDGTAEDHAAIENRFQRFAVYHGRRDTTEAASQADFEFHLAIIQASHNGLFVTVGAALRSALRVSSRLLQEQAAEPLEDLALHDKVRGAISARTPGDAARAMPMLLEATRDRVRPYAMTAGR